MPVSGRGKPRPSARTRAENRGSPKPVGAWDVNRMIVEAGGPEALRVAHADHGFKRLTPAQVSNWRTRYVIPSDRLAEVLITMRALIGSKFDPMQYIALETAKSR